MDTSATTTGTMMFDEFDAALSELRAAKDKAAQALAAMRAARAELLGRARVLTAKIDAASIAIGAPGRRRKTTAGADGDEGEDGEGGEEEDGAGTIIPEGFRFGGAVRELCGNFGWTAEQFEAEEARFVDYWSSVAGARGRKLDWQATAKNWVRHAEERRPTAEDALAATVTAQLGLDNAAAA